MVREVLLTKGYVALVSDEDYERINKHKWFVADGYANTAYASTYLRNDSGMSRKVTRMHRFILGAKEGEEVDHRDGDGLNNTRENIRLISHQLNVTRGLASPRNKTGYIGVFPHQGRYRARIGYYYKTINVGVFDTASEAASARDKALVKLYGDDAPISKLLNHPIHNS